MENNFSENNNMSNKENKNNKPKFGIEWLYFIIFGFIFLIYFFNSSGRVQRTTWKDFINNMVLSHDVEKVVIVNNRIVEVYIKK